MKNIKQTLFFLMILSSSVSQATTLVFTGVLDHFGTTALPPSTAPFQLTLSFDPNLADVVNTTSTTIDLLAGNDYALSGTSSFTESVRLDIGGVNYVNLVNIVPGRSENYISNNLVIGSDFKNEISSFMDITFPDTSRFTFSIDLNHVLPTVTPFIGLNFTDSVSLSYPGAAMSFLATDANGDYTLQGDGVPNGFSINYTSNAVPEPSTLALFLLGFVGMIRQHNRG